MSATRVNEPAAVRTLLELVAELMEESFAVMGEGQILGTMPSYLERFGAGNARYVAREHLGSGAVVGPRSALSPMGLVSHVTTTDFGIEDVAGGVVKRLSRCEFQEAFRDRGEFPRAMMCMLHRAAYQGSVNGLVPPERGFDVQVTKRILFGDDHCEFLVTPRSDVDPDDAPIPARRTPGDEESQRLAYHFYTFLLTSFVDYLSHHLEDDVVEDMLRRVAARVGQKAQDLIASAAVRRDAAGNGAIASDAAGNGAIASDAAGNGAVSSDADGGAAQQMGRAILEMGGRTLGEGLHVTSCPQAPSIRSTATGADEADKQRVRRNACRLCKNLVAAAVREADPMATVHRQQSLALGDDVCDYEVRRVG